MHAVLRMLRVCVCGISPCLCGCCVVSSQACAVGLAARCWYAVWGRGLRCTVAVEQQSM